MSTPAESIQLQQATASPVVTVALVGDSRLAAALMRDLCHEPHVITHHWASLDELRADPDASQARLVVALSTHWRPAHDQAIQAWCWEHHVAFLRASIWQREAVVGPLVRPGVPGCLECAERRRLRTLVLDPYNEARFLTWCQDEKRMAVRLPNPWATAAAIKVISALSAAEIQAFLGSDGAHAAPNSVRFIDLLSLTESKHLFLPDPLCATCGTTVNDAAEDAVVHFVPRPLPRPDSHRLRSLADELEALEARYTGTRLGLVPTPVNIRSASAFALAITACTEYPYNLMEISCGGHSYSFRSSRASAIAEALERYSGHFPRRKRSTVYGSYRQLRDQAINPEHLGLYSPEQYAQLSQRNDPQRCVPYHPDLQFSWVWGYSLRTAKPILVPEQIAYYSMQGMRPLTEQFIRENSNGCALGASIEEATLYGLMEVLERDAFLLTWYACLKLPAIAMQSTRDVKLKLAIERSERLNGFTYYAFDNTTDFGLPIALVVGVNRADEAPKMACATGAHWDPDRALANAFHETAGMVAHLKTSPPQSTMQDWERGERLVANGALVQSIEDHVLLGAMPAAFPRIGFLFQNQPKEPMSVRFAAQYAAGPSNDLTKILARIIDRIMSRGYDVVIVDQTAPELRESHLYCVRVLVPGLIPMTFCHGFERIYGLDRLYRTPQELGYADHILRAAELNPYPHPFP
jgi:ribosomal protein S12 methylthiotransferase accessory factor